MKTNPRLPRVALFFSVVFGVLPGVVRAQPGLPMWTNRYSGPGNADDFARAVAVDATGNVLVAGSSNGGTSGDDFLTIKYSSAGVPLWTNRYSGPGNYDDSPYAVAVDPNGNVVVTGGLFNGANYDYVTIKYSSTGVPLWTNRYNGPGNGDDLVAALAVDPWGDVVVTGGSPGSGSSEDYATIKYSGAGQPLWTNRYNGPGNSEDEALAMAMDRSGNVVVTGSSRRTSSYGSEDYLTIVYSSAGLPLWTNRYNGAKNEFDAAHGVAVAASGNVLVTGWSSTGEDMFDYQTIAYTSAGVPLWTNRYDGPGHDFDVVHAVAADQRGNVVVTGSSRSGSSYSSEDYATIAYSSAGLPLWTNRYNGAARSNDDPSAMALDAQGNIYVTGYSRGDGSGRDFLTIAYSSAGLPLWTNRFKGPLSSDDMALAIAVDASGGIYVVGGSGGTGSGYDFVILKYAAALPAAPIITNTFRTSAYLVFAGTGGGAGGTYYVQSSTNVPAGMTNWSRVATNTFGAGGSFAVTNTLDQSTGRQFFRLEVP